MANSQELLILNGKYALGAVFLSLTFFGKGNRKGPLLLVKVSDQ